MPRIRFTLLLLAFGAAAPQAGQSMSPDERLGKGLHQEQVEENCPLAITTYKTVVDDPRAKAATAARASFQMGGCYEQLGKPREARTAFQDVLKKAAPGTRLHTLASARVSGPQSTPDPLTGRVIDDYFKDATQLVASPTGTLVAYTKPSGRTTLMLGEKTDIPMLYVRDLSTGRERLLVDPKDRTELISRPTWSPDSTAIAYFVRLLELDPSKPAAKFDGWLFDLRIVDVKSGGVRTISAGQASGTAGQIYWSPDGKALAYLRREVDLSKPAREQRPLQAAIWNRATGRSVDVGAVTGGPPPPTLAWSPDSEQVAFFANDSRERELTIVRVANGSRRTVGVPAKPENGTSRLQGWHRSGDLSVVYNIPRIGNDFYMVPSDGRPARKVCEGRGVSGGDGCQAPDPMNTFVIARKQSEGGRAYLRDLATAAERPFTDAAVFEQPVVLPRGGERLIVFRSEREGDNAIYVAPVDQMPVRKPLRIATLDAPTSSASGWWTPDGLVLNISRTDQNIYRVPVDPRTGRPTGPPQRLTHENPVNTLPTVSADGSKILYRVRGRQTGFGLMDSNGANERLVYKVPSDLLNDGVTWLSPTELLIHPGRVTGPARFSTVNLTTGASQALAQPDLSGAGLTYVPAKGEVFYGRIQNPAPPGVEIWARSVKTGHDRLVATTRNYTQFFAPSDDGDRVFYSTADESVADGAAVPAEIRVINVKTGEDKALLSYKDSKGALNVIPVAHRGRYLLYQDPEKVQRIMDLETAETWPLLTEPLNGVNPEGFGGTWAPDGSYVLFEGWARRAERRQWKGLTYDSVVRLMQR